MDKTNYEVLKEYYDKAVEALASDVVHWAESNGDDRRCNIQVARLAGEIRAYRHALRYFPRPPMVGHNCPKLADSFTGTIEAGKSCEYCGWVAQKDDKA